MTFPCLDNCGGGYGFKSCIFMWNIEFECQHNSDSLSQRLTLTHFVSVGREGKGRPIHCMYTIYPVFIVFSIDE